MSFAKKNWLATWKNQIKNSRRGGGAHSYSQLNPQLKAKKDFKIKNSGKSAGAYRTFAAGSAAFLFAFVAGSVLMPVKDSSAEESELDININGGSYNLSVSASELLEMEVDTVSVTGAFASTSDELTVAANVPNGYQLYLSVDNNHENGNRLYLDGDSTSGFIAPNYDSSTKEELDIDHPATLQANTWGFTNTAANNESKVYSAVPLMGGGALISEETSAGTYHPMVYYAVNVNSNMDTGTYKGNLVYTVIGDDMAGNYDIPSVSKEKVAMNDSVTVTGLLPMAVANTEDLGTVTVKIGGETCANATVSSSAEAVNVSCTVPFLSTAGAKDVELYVQKFNKTYLAEGGVSYMNLSSISTMQEMTTNICKGTAAGSTIYNLEDTRGRGLNGNGSTELDGSSKKTYGVIRALDGNCWMTENFDLYGTEISAAESDFTDGTYSIPTSTNWSGNQYTVPLVHKATNTNWTDQVYYNWTTAVALYNGSTAAEQDQSVCPKGWQLPVNGDASKDKSYAKLMSVYGVTTGPNLVNPSHASYVLGFTRYYGDWIYDNASEYSQGSSGVFWSSTPASGTNAYSLHYYTSGINPQNSSAKGYGFSIRCVAR